MTLILCQVLLVKTNFQTSKEKNHHQIERVNITSSLQITWGVLYLIANSHYEDLSQILLHSCAQHLFSGEIGLLLQSIISYCGDYLKSSSDITVHHLAYGDVPGNLQITVTRFQEHRIYRNCFHSFSVVSHNLRRSRINIVCVALKWQKLC